MGKIRPNIYVNNIYDINYEQLKSNGIKLLCYDLDNTLDMPDNMTKSIDNTLEKKFNELQKDFEILIVSNNTIENRVNSFATLYNLNYIEGMNKPFKKKYKHEIILNYKKEEVIFVGDKIVTDVFGALHSGYKCILVDPLFPKKKVWYNKIMAFADYIVQPLIGLKRGTYFNELEKNGK